MASEAVCSVDPEYFHEDVAPSRREERDRALVARVACEIADRGAAEHDVLLADLLCAAWPTARCQMQ